MNEYGLEYLKKKLAIKSNRVMMRYNYYEMKNGIRELSGIIPADFCNLSEVLGWCAKAVDTLSDRLIVDGFENDNFYINEIYKYNNPDVLFDSAIVSALISSCSFIFIGMEDNYPKMQVIDGSNATGIIDQTTNLMTEGYAILERDKYKKPLVEAYFTPNKTIYYRNGIASEELNHTANSALLVPIIYRPDAKRPFGHSRISRACMKITQSALRTLRRSEVAAEFYSFPQKYVLGLEADAEWNSKLATMSSFLSFGNDGKGNKPSVGQFQSSNLAPFSEHIKMFASLFAGETGLTLDDLGFVTSNPSSEGAIRAAHENLRLTARKAQRTFGTGFLNAAYLSACLRDNKHYDRKAFADSSVSWAPIFEPDSSTLGAIGDAIIKINQASEGFLGSNNIRKLTGLRSDANG